MRTLDYKLRPSHYYLSLVLICLIGSVIVINTLPLSFSWRMLLIWLAMSYAGWISWQDGLLLGRHAITNLRPLGKGRWRIDRRDKQEEVVLCGGSTVTRFVTILLFILPKTNQRLRFQRYRRCLIFADSLPPHDYRQLVVALRVNHHV